MKRYIFLVSCLVLYTSIVSSQKSWIQLVPEQEHQTHKDEREDDGSLSAGSSQTGMADIIEVLYHNGIHYDDESIHYLTGKPDPRVLSVPESIQNAVFKRSADGLPVFIDCLTRNADNEYHVVKCLHMLQNRYGRITHLDGLRTCMECCGN
jgi:hypothetical protein